MDRREEHRGRPSQEAAEPGGRADEPVPPDQPTYPPQQDQVERQAASRDTRARDPQNRGADDSREDQQSPLSTSAREAREAMREPGRPREDRRGSSLVERLNDALHRLRPRGD